MSFLELTETQIRRLQDYWDVFGTDAGKRVLEDMEKEYGGLPYTKGFPSDTHRKIGNLEVLNDIKRALSVKNMEIRVVKEEREEE